MEKASMPRLFLRLPIRAKPQRPQKDILFLQKAAKGVEIFALLCYNVPNRAEGMSRRSVW
jgi:hypothetical protein